MEKLKITNIKIVLFTLLFGAVSLIATAQKLPVMQELSLRAPSDIKIDGMTTEWNNQFQAYNKHTDFYYTISNDDNNLYVTIQATDPHIISRIIRGGITLSINKSGKKDDKESMRITYPIFDKNNKFFVSFKNAPKLIPGSAASVMQVDSFVNVTNNTMTAKAKLIGIAGIKNIDTLISVYNTNGIKAAALFDNKIRYNYELAIPLKKLELSLNNPLKFSYQLMINEVLSSGVTIKEEPGQMKVINFSGPNITLGQSATDFWGDYTLAK